MWVYILNNIVDIDAQVCSSFSVSYTISAIIAFIIYRHTVNLFKKATLKKTTNWFSKPIID